uniref:Bromodomain associated domain-containing protein n=1 Tax=Grammatophora oceanica TaxID=210454 RepID=A0A7S1V7E7_9STRA
MSAESDLCYTHELARRSAARAALHLGIDSCSEEALGVMADVLVAYIERVGEAMSKLVEASGRSSQHCNLLDAVKAIETATPSGLMSQLHLLQDDGTPNGDSGSQPHPSTLNLGNKWQDLAVFLWGPEWNRQSTRGPGSAAGGKVGPSATNQAPGSQGWEAPYLDEIPPYPIAVKTTCANPHPMAPQQGLSLHTDVLPTEGDAENGATDSMDFAAKELQDIPDSIFWGQLVTPKKSSVAATVKGKRKRSGADEEAPAAKKVRMEDDGAAKKEAAQSEATQKEDESSNDEKAAPRAPYLSAFMPSFPDVSHKRTVMEAATAASSATAAEDNDPSSKKDASGTNTVKESLVNLQGFYWGSGWDKGVAVGAGTAGVGALDNTKAVVVPIGRASGSRVSRILEGSMDVLH